MSNPDRPKKQIEIFDFIFENRATQNEYKSRIKFEFFYPEGEGPLVKSLEILENGR